MEICLVQNTRMMRTENCEALPYDTLVLILKESGVHGVMRQGCPNHFSLRQNQNIL